MAQKVKKVMTAAPAAPRPSQPLTEAGRAMRQQGVGSVLMVGHGRLKGLVAGRDIIARALADGRDPCGALLTLVLPEPAGRALAEVSGDEAAAAAVAAA